LKNETKLVVKVKGHKPKFREKIMMDVKNNRITQRIMMMAILTTGLFLVSASFAISQETCKSAETLARESASASELNAQRDCWMRKVKSGTANLSGAYLKGVNLSKMDLSGRRFARADLSGADLSGTNLLFANMNWANLSGANLSGADIRKASLVLADLSGANVNGAVSSGANLKNIKLADGNYIVRLRLTNMVCTMSDDEGYDNDADMGLFDIKVNDIVLYYWKGDPITTAKGYTWKVNREILFVSDQSRILFNLLGKAVEYDFIGGGRIVSKGNENDHGSGNSRFEVYKPQGTGGILRHNFQIESSDFRYTVNLEAETLAP
jgi:hypothetical protein